MMTGEIAMKAGLTMTFSRNMVVLKADGTDDLVVIHPIRMSEAGLEQLEKLGTVKHIIRLSAFHGRDDPFFKHRYKNATVWAVEDTKYVRGFDLDSEPIFQPDRYMKDGDDDTTLPVKGATLHTIQGRKGPPEGALMLNRSGKKTLIVGDSLQHHAKKCQYRNWYSNGMMYCMGFYKPNIVGPIWAKVCCVEKKEMEDKLLSLKFDNVLPAHGVPVLEDAWKKFEPAVKAMKV